MDSPRLIDLIRDPELAAKFRQEYAETVPVSVTDQHKAAVNEVMSGVLAKKPQRQGSVLVQHRGEDIPHPIKWLVVAFTDVVESGQMRWCSHFLAHINNGTMEPMAWIMATRDKAGCIPCTMYDLELKIGDGESSDEDRRCDRCGKTSEMFYCVQLPLGVFLLQACICEACNTATAGGYPLP